jgi:Flp pilus assembly secretin CpaC
MRNNKHRADGAGARSWPIRSLVVAGFWLAACGLPPARAADQPIVAIVDQARLIKIPAGTQTLIIGNPTIADVTLLRQANLMVLTPKAFGETNFIALDVDGNPVAEAMIEVVNGSDALVVQRGMDRQSYSCAPKCQPVERLGDDDKYLTSVASATQAHNQRLMAVQAPTGLAASTH